MLKTKKSIKQDPEELKMFDVCDERDSKFEE